MFTTILYFLPSIVSGLWFFIFLTKMKNRRQTLYTLLSAAFVFYFATNAIFITPTTDYDALVVMDAFDIPLALAIEAIIGIYFHFFHSKPKFTGIQILCFIPAIVVGTIANLLYYIIGFDNAALLVELLDEGAPLPPEFQTEIYRMYRFFSEPFVNFCTFIIAIFITFEYVRVAKKKGYRFGSITRFFFKKGTITPEFAIATLIMTIMMLQMPMIIFGRRFFHQHVNIGIIWCFLFAVIMHFVSYIEYYSDSKTTLTLYNLLHQQVAPPPPPTADDTDGEVAAAPEVKAVSPRMMMAAERFHTLMEHDHIYKDENISLTTIAEELGVSRASLSQLIMATYGRSFRELLTSYRIHHAQQYMLSHPTATQEIVAHECGYKNAQYLNSKFKEVTGSTPAMWMAQNSNPTPTSTP